jgi:uncharacterized protein (DUF433 family)
MTEEPQEAIEHRLSKVANMSTATRYRHLAPNPKSWYKQLFVKDTRIQARTLYGAYASEEEPRTPEQIAADFNVSLEAVREAIRYCDSDPPELREDYQREEALMEACGMNDPNYKAHGKPKLLTPQQLARFQQ